MLLFHRKFVLLWSFNSLMTPLLRSRRKNACLKAAHVRRWVSVPTHLSNRLLMVRIIFEIRSFSKWGFFPLFVFNKVSYFSLWSSWGLLVENFDLVLIFHLFFNGALGDFDLTNALSTGFCLLDAPNLSWVRISRNKEVVWDEILPIAFLW